MNFLPVPPIRTTNPMYGRSIQFDPVFAYYRGRSEESIASEIDVNGYKVVRYIVTNDLDVNDGLIAALHRRGIKVWYQTFGNGFYGKPRGLPPGWEKWQMVLLHKDEADYTFLSLSNSDYRAWKTSQISKVMHDHAFDGAEIAEPFQMGWEGPEKGSYGDFSDSAVGAFSQYSGYPSPPDFSHPKQGDYYKTDVARYRKWVDFRVHEVSSFVRQLREGSAKARGDRPFSIWTLVNSSPDKSKSGQELIREWQGVDAVDIATQAKPDLICFETNWPDWMTPSLPGNYPLGYRSFTSPLQSAFPKMPFIFQADLGSSPASRRSEKWIVQFEKSCLEVGASGSTLYMRGIEKGIYTEAPEVREVHRTGEGLQLIFQKRLEPNSAMDLSHYRISPSLNIRSAKWDGNTVFLDVGSLDAGQAYRVSIDGVMDDPRQWIFKDGVSHRCTQTIEIPIDKRGDHPGLADSPPS